MTKSCEKYIISKNKWEKISDLNFPSANASLCVFNEKFIFKFGGCTEKNL